MNPVENSPTNIGSTIIVTLIFLAGVVVFGVAARDWYKNTYTPRSAVVISPTPLPQPTNTPMPQIAPKTKISIQVQNGSGIPGMAGKLKELLLEAGYEEVDTANAQAYQYDQTVVMSKAGAQEEDGKIRSVLQSKYQVDPKINVLDDQSPYEMVIIVGKK